MYKILNEYEYWQEFEKCGRENEFTYQGIASLFEYFTQFEDDTGHEIEADPIAVCVEYTEYKVWQELHDNYDSKFEFLEELEDITDVIQVEGTDRIIIRDF